MAIPFQDVLENTAFPESQRLRETQNSLSRDVPFCGDCPEKSALGWPVQTNHHQESPT